MTAGEAFYKCYDKGERIEKLEKFIATDAYYSFRYARDVLNGRFEEGEKAIANNAESSYSYALIIKELFPLGHAVIFNSNFKKDYIVFLKKNKYDLSEIQEWLI